MKPQDPANPFGLLTPEQSILEFTAPMLWSRRLFWPLKQFGPTYNPGFDTVLPPYLPSISESLGVLAGCTALMASAVSLFIHYWNYSSTTTLASPQYQYFNATVKYKDFASGGSEEWQGIFYLVLVAVFAINVFCLGYLVKNFCVDGMVTDYTEPQNLFAVALMSQPVQGFKGSCGAGPKWKLLGRRWRVEMGEGGGDSGAVAGAGAGGGGGGEEMGRAGVRHPHFYVRCPGDEYQDWGKAESVRQKETRMRRSRPKSMSGWWSSESPAMEQYRRLAKM